MYDDIHCVDGVSWCVCVCVCVCSVMLPPMVGSKRDEEGKREGVFAAGVTDH